MRESVNGYALPKFALYTTERYTVIVKQNISRFAEKVNFFVVFVRTCREKTIAERLQTALDKKEYVVFVPTKDYAFKKEGTVTIRRVPLISSYVFIATTRDSVEAIQSVIPLIHSDSTAFKLLSNDKGRDGESFEFRTEDKTIMAAFLDILDDEFNIRAIPARIVDGKIEILKNTLEPYGGEIIKVKKNQQSAVVRLTLLNRVYDCEIALEFCDEKSIRESVKNSEHGILRRTSDILKVGDTVEVISGTMSGNVSEIVRFDGDDVVVEFDMLGEKRETKVGVDEVRVVVGV